MPLPYKIFLKYFSKKNIQKVYNESIRNKPSVGIDGKNIDCFDRNLKQEIEIIYRKILQGSYNFSFYKEKLILKGKNKYPRVISIPTIRDKIVEETIKNFVSIR
jgi:retron-type reverse transcriptase